MSDELTTDAAIADASTVEETPALPPVDVVDEPLTRNEERVVMAAIVAHEANRAYCVLLGDRSQESWAAAAEWQRISALNGARDVLAGKITAPGDAHASWMAEKLADGWTYGEKKDADAKTHPCLVPFDALPVEQRVKDALFLSVVSAFRA